MKQHLLALIISTNTLANPVDAPPKIVTSGGAKSLTYLVYEPSLPPPRYGYPILLFLHGAGERGRDVNLINVHGPVNHRSKVDALRKSFMITPQCPHDEWWNADAILNVLDEFIKKHKALVDTERIYVTGLSMGGYATWSLLSKAPHRFAAATPICGGGHTDSLRISLKTANASSVDPKILIQTKTPIWAFHGTRDEVVPYEESAKLVHLLTTNGHANARLTAYNDVGHDAWTQTYQSAELYDWMFKQTRRARD